MKNMIVKTSVYAVAGLVLMACDGEKAAESGESTSGKVAELKKKAKAVKEVAKGATKAVKIGSEGLGEAMTDKVNWEVEIEGVDLPKQSGAMVIAQKVGPSMSYAFASETGMNRITLRDVEKHQTGEFDPYSVQIMWPKEQWSCSYASARKGKEFAVKVKKEGKGVRADFEGETTCRHVAKDSKAEPKEAKIKGWFID